jgi:hypothetical protein
VKTLTFYGSSDDLVEAGGEEYNAESGVFRLATPDGHGIRVEVTYTGAGVWGIGVEPLISHPLDDPAPLPAGWELHLGQGGDGSAAPVYSMRLTAIVDDDAVLTYEGAP